MAKGWIPVGTVDKQLTYEEKKRIAIKQNKLMNRMIAKTPSLSYEKLQEESENAYKMKLAEEADLRLAYKSKRLKSKTLINRAKALEKNSTDKAVVA